MRLFIIKILMTLKIIMHLYIPNNFFTTVNDYLEIKIGKQLIVLSHYPFPKLERLVKVQYILHGHTHGNIIV